MRALATFAAAWMLMSAMAHGAVAGSSVTLKVRLYNTAGISTPQLVAARDTAGGILGDSGLNVVFRHCGRGVSPGEPVDSCSEPLAPSELVVRIINAPAFNATLHPDAFGLAYVVKGADRGWLATVFPDRIDRAATRAGIEAGTLLGRVMAHEVGHLLLGNRYHGDAGVMRARWPDTLLHRTGDEWRFSLTEAERIQRQLLSMTSAPLAAAF